MTRSRTSSDPVVGMKPEDVKVDAVLRYHPITNRADFVLVKIVEAPWQLGSGDWICKAKRADDFAIVRPWVGALAPNGADA